MAIPISPVGGGKRVEQTSFDLVDPDPVSYTFPCIRARQPVGDLYIASIPFKILIKISYFDVRRVLTEERDVERYLGIQRPLDPRRADELGRYVNYADASFPTSIILAIEEEYASYDNDKGQMTLRNQREEDAKPSIAISRVARVLDGQHRIAGLERFSGNTFDLTVTIFIGADISDQAQLFATVNLEQTKVNKSLVYDLFELAKARSPQKSCHNIAVALDQELTGPLYRRIKRLGIASEGRELATITQATFVEMLLRYISIDPKGDRDLILRGRRIPKASDGDVYEFPFRNMFIDGRDVEIGMVVSNYFEAVRQRWPEAWDYRGQGRILNRTNGFRALMRFLRHSYLEVGKPGDVPTVGKFLDNSLRNVIAKDSDFTIENFPPGSAGESRLVRILRRQEAL
jgi:DGQHR domain-containing protein